MMSKSIDLAAAEFDMTVRSLVNGCGLPACVVRLTLDKIMREVESVEQKNLQQERENQFKQQGDTEEVAE